MLDDVEIMSEEEMDALVTPSLDDFNSDQGIERRREALHFVCLSRPGMHPFANVPVPQGSHRMDQLADRLKNMTPLQRAVSP